MRLSVIIPVYNERDTLEQIVTHVEEAEFDKEIIIVDDGSTDGTRDILTKWQQENHPRRRIFLQPKNQGKGAAVRRGIKEAQGDIVLIKDDAL